MRRQISLETEKETLNEWVLKSLELYENTPYLDNISAVYPFDPAVPERLPDELRRRLITAHTRRRTEELIDIFRNELQKFPYDEPMWFQIKNVQNAAELNRNQVERIATSLYNMTAEETVVRLESPPKLNTQIGPMFNYWLRENFELLEIDDFINSNNGIYILDASEIVGKTFINKHLDQDLAKRPDLVAKVNNTFIIGEAKWIGCPGGNQDKQIVEVRNFCREQRGKVIRVGIIDGFPWATRNRKNRIFNFKSNILTQESEYDILSALLLRDYFGSFIH